MQESQFLHADLQFFSEYAAMGGHPLLLEWHGSAMISRIVWEFVEGFPELRTYAGTVWPTVIKLSMLTDMRKGVLQGSATPQSQAGEQRLHRMTGIN